MLVLVLPPVSIIDGVSRDGPLRCFAIDSTLVNFWRLCSNAIARSRRRCCWRLPRGGVPVAAVLVRELMLPLEVLPVHKLGAPRQPELAIGAVAGDDLVVLDHDAIASMGISQAEMDSAIARERAELFASAACLSGRAGAACFEGQTVILVDDGLATGYTMLAAVRCVRQREPACIVVAVPVAPRETLEMLRRGGG